MTVSLHQWVQPFLNSNSENIDYIEQCVSLYCFFFACHRPTILEAAYQKRALWLLCMSMDENERVLLQSP